MFCDYVQGRRSGVGKLVYQVDDIKLNGAVDADGTQRPITLDVKSSQNVSHKIIMTSFEFDTFVY